MDNFKKQAWAFVVLMGIVSLFADITYEGARSIYGPFLNSFGTSATVVGFIAGMGELIGYGLRLFSGILADRTKKYWIITFIGYFINLVAIPMLAIAGNWQFAAILIVLERTGKAIRNPARDVMLSHAASFVGHGKSFGIHEALDQIGAITGSLFVGISYTLTNNFSKTFAFLAIPATFAIITLLIARINFPTTKELEIKNITKLKNIELKKFFWLYLLATAFIAIGFADYPLIAYHFSKNNIVKTNLIPVLYAGAMGIDAIAAIIMGRFFDKYGIKTLILSTIISLFFAPLAFWGKNFLVVILGMICWGIGMAAQESIVRSVLSLILPSDKKGTGFGIFYAVFGLAWFAGSFFMGWLYEISLMWIVIFSITMQLGAIPIILAISNKIKK